MIEIEKDDAHAVLTVTVSDRLHKDDYERLLPAFTAFAQEHGRVSVLLVMRGFEGWDLGAAWEDTKLGFQHFGEFRRIALAGERGWQRVMGGLCHVMTAAPVKFFGLDELEKARAWILGPADGSVQLELDEAAGIARVSIEGALSPEDFERVTPRIDEFIERQGEIRIRLDLREFEGWDSLEALLDHLSFVRKHHKRAGRLAVIGDRAWQRAASAMIRVALHPEVKIFTSLQIDDAEKWLSES